MAKDQPAWLSLVQKFERTIGEPVEKFVRSETYFDLVTQATRTAGQWQRAVADVQREWLHFFNLPANSDVTALREQLSRVERRLAEVRKELEDLEQDGAGVRGIDEDGAYDRDVAHIAEAAADGDVVDDVDEPAVGGAAAVGDVADVPDAVHADAGSDVPDDGDGGATNPA